MAKIIVYEYGQGPNEEVTTLKVAIIVLKSDVDQLKSIDIYMVLGTVEIPNFQEIPLAPIRDAIRAEWSADLESEGNTDEDILRFLRKHRMRSSMRQMRP